MEQTVTPLARTMATRRAQLGVTLRDLSHASGMSRQQLSQIVSEAHPFNLYTLRRIAMLLHCPPDVLLCEDPAAAVSYPLPPANYLHTVRTFADELGFNDSRKVVPFATYAQLCRLHADATPPAP